MANRTASSDRRTAVAVVGAGIVGVAAALHLRRDGHDVTLIDRNPPGEGASFGNAGVIASYAVVPTGTPGIVWQVPGMLRDPLGPLSLRWAYVPRMLPWFAAYVRNTAPRRVEHISTALAEIVGGGVEEHRALADRTGAEKWLQFGPLIVPYRDEAAYARDDYIWTLRRKRGVRWTTFGRSELQAIEPAVRSDHAFGAAIEHQGYVRDPSRYVKDLASYFQRVGGHILRTEVKTVESSGGRPARLLTDDGAVAFDDLVLAAGAWSGGLARSLGSAVPLESERGYHVTLTAPGIQLSHPVVSAAGKFIATPMAMGLRLAGTVEFGGLDAPPNAARARALLIHAERLFPNVDIRDHTVWMGHRPTLPDNLPVIGRSPVHGNVYFAFGHQHIGLTAGPKTGRLIADLIAGRTPNIDLTPFRADRF